MQKKDTLLRFIYKNSYLLVTAGWLITISFIIDNYWSDNSSSDAVKRKLENYIHNQQKDFEQLTKDTLLLGKLVSKNYDEKLLQQQTEKKYFFYLYHFNENALLVPVFWNTQAVKPSDELLNNNTDTSGFVQLQNGYYVWHKAFTSKGLAIALIPVKWNYVITNEYLKNSFVIGEDIENNYDISLEAGAARVKCLNGKTLFFLDKKPGSVIAKNNTVSIWLRISATIIIFLFLHLCAVFIAMHNRLWKAVAFLLGILLVLRVLSYYFPIPLNLRQFELFDPAIYGSSIILRSLGDLLINAVLFVWVILFIRHHLYEKKYAISSSAPMVKWGMLIVVALIFLTATFICGHILRSMVADSQISFDVINFYTLNSYSIIGFIVLCCIAIGYFVLGQILLYLLRPLFPENFVPLYIAVAVLGLTMLTIGFNLTIVAFELYLLIWLLLFLVLLSNNYLALLASGISSTRLVFWLFFFSLTIMAVIVEENTIKEMRNRRHYAEALSTKADPTSETLMNTLLTDFRSDALAANFDKFKNDSTNQVFKDSLVNGNFTGYNDKYDTRIYTFDANEKPLYNRDSSGFNELNTILSTQARITGIPDLYYYDESYDRFSYISKKTVTDTAGKLLGYVFILAGSKRFKTETPYPELFSRGNNYAIENSSVYAFAVYANLQLVSSHNDYAFSTRLAKSQVPKEEFEIQSKKGYDELWYKAGPGNVVIIAKQDNFLLESMTLFSYLFCAFLLVTGIFWLINMFIRSRLDKDRMKTYWQLSIRNQIHGTVIFISILSFVVIGVATYLFFIRRSENSNRERLSRTIHVMENEVRNSLSELSVFDDVVKIYDPGFKEKLEQTIKKIAEIHVADINLYDLDGNLKVSSLPYPYNIGIVSTQMDPTAYYHINKLKEVQYFKEEKIGSLSFVSNYVPVIDETGKEYAYLNIPYYTSESKLKLEIANFLVTIINLNAFIFLIAGIVALFITNRITQSFSFISDKMKEVNLGKMNEAIDWKRNDEIGELVKEYNKMVAKLDDSANALAKSEREGAWREMARQVAHEIKNPLTPMKLSLQYLQKAIANNSDNVRELTNSVSQTLVEQINHLSQIAGEFSQFANIGNPRNEVFDIHEVLYLVTQLYSTHENVHLDCAPLPNPVMINADRTHVNRLFTNLIQNAIQAVPEGKTPVIEVDEELKGDKILVKVKDNGMGIPENMRSKIFTPNFTTKTSGTGLGLAMCKGIVEQAQGEIWFETSAGNGTIFFVELPVVQAT
ncbi:MAG: HAMP domain-containing histidine kinase [Bacteroidetes bacterium]|nr:HAMP domain-containing histidine kinase [Bacteroidota bacterium]